MPRNPESSTAVSAYRRILPGGLRRRIDRTFSVTARQRVKGALSGVSLSSAVATVRGGMHRLVHPAFHSGDRRVTVAVGRSPRVAHVHGTLTALTARQANQDVVVAALEAAGIDYFAVADPGNATSALAVEATSAAAACRALSKTARATAGYWAWAYEGDESVGAELRPGTKSFAWSPQQHPDAVRLVWFRTDSRGRLVLGEEYACEVQFWHRDATQLVTGRRNRVTQELPIGDPVVESAAGELLTRLAPAGSAELPVVRTRAAFTTRRPDDVAFPIDVVYTWVDGADERWKRKRAEAMREPYHEDAANDARYLSRDELLYSLRSLSMYAPWVRHVYVVTDDQVPDWLDESVPGITVVDHTEIFTDRAVLPTFNSHAIESQLHHIDGLSEHFLYFNDDMLLGAVVMPEDFFYANGIAMHFPSPANVPSGEPSDEDAPVSAAAKNNRRLIRDRFGTVITQKMKHAPYALRRSVLAEIEEAFESEHRATASHTARDRGDLSIASSLHHYYALETGRSVPADIRYSYVDLDKSDAARQLGLILAGRDSQAICLNSISTTEHGVDPAVLAAFLEAYFPMRSPFERA